MCFDLTGIASSDLTNSDAKYFPLTDFEIVMLLSVPTSSRCIRAFMADNLGILIVLSVAFTLVQW